MRVTPAGHSAHYRVLAGWHGGYLGADEWRMNSGIVKVQAHYHDPQDKASGPLELRFHGASGSLYRCVPAAYGVTDLMASVFRRISNPLIGGPAIEFEMLDRDEAVFLAWAQGMTA